MAFDDRTTCELRNKERSYERIGLYMHTPENGYENFCDIHVSWNTQAPEKGKLRMSFTGYKAWYSGPMESVSQIKTLERSQLEKDEYARYKNVSPDLDIDAGGYALVVDPDKTGWSGPKMLPNFSDFKNKSSKVKPATVWLFGPLMFNNSAYGSLYVELTGSFVAGKGFQPLKVFGSSYSDGFENFRPKYAGQDDYDKFLKESYDKHLQSTYSVPVPQKGKYLWKIESYGKNKTGCQVIRKKEKGLSSETE